MLLETTPAHKKNTVKKGPDPSSENGLANVTFAPQKPPLGLSGCGDGWLCFPTDILDLGAGTGGVAVCHHLSAYQHGLVIPEVLEDRLSPADFWELLAPQRPAEHSLGRSCPQQWDGCIPRLAGCAGGTPTALGASCPVLPVGSGSPHLMLPDMPR